MTPTDQVSWHEVTGKMKPLPSIGIVLQTFFMEFYLWSSSLPKAKMKCFKSSPNLLWWITIFPFLERRRIPKSYLTKVLFFVLLPGFMINNFDLNHSDNPPEKNGTSPIHNAPNNAKSSSFGPRFQDFPAFFIRCQTCPACPSTKPCQKIHGILGWSEQELNSTP